MEASPACARARTTDTARKQQQNTDRHAARATARFSKTRWTTFVPVFCPSCLRLSLRHYVSRSASDVAFDCNDAKPPPPPISATSDARVWALAFSSANSRYAPLTRVRGRLSVVNSIGLVASRATARFIPFGVRAVALVRDNVFKVEYPKKLNFRLSHTYIDTEERQRLQGRVSQKVKLSLSLEPKKTKD